jgi:hypothetical protein
MPAGSAKPGVDALGLWGNTSSGAPVPSTAPEEPAAPDGCPLPLFRSGGASLAPGASSYRPLAP